MRPVFVGSDLVRLFHPDSYRQTLLTDVSLAAFVPHTSSWASYSMSIGDRQLSWLVLSWLDLSCLDLSCLVWAYPILWCNEAKAGRFSGADWTSNTPLSWLTTMSAFASLARCCCGGLQGLKRQRRDEATEAKAAKSSKTQHVQPDGDKSVGSDGNGSDGNHDHWRRRWSMTSLLATAHPPA